MPVTLSSKHQVIVPETICKAHDFKPGMRFEFIDDGATIRFVPVRGLKTLRGFLKGRLKTSDVEREETDRPL
jgi:bifunctional DNA-binding transcriptional regulator/antitoxin component of YhaV-PrlF toxin-antitoxin module